MALIKLGPMVGSISGSIAATTFARNRAGWYARARTKPKIPVSIKRDQAQARLSATVAAWHNDLTNAYRLLWTQKASHQVFTNKVGDAYVPTGLNLFVKANTQLREAGKTPVTTAPAVPIAPVFAPVIAWTTAVGIRITNIGGYATPTSGACIFRWALNLKQSKNFYKGPWDDCSNFGLDSLDTLPMLIIASAALIANTRAFFKFNIVLADGSTSTPTINYVDVGSPA
jgi:hypothetical protein